MLIYFPSRDKARKFGSKVGKSPIDLHKGKAEPTGKRWAVNVKKTQEV